MILDLSYNTGRLQSYIEAVFVLFQAALLCNDSWVRARSLRPATWSGELSDNYTATPLQQWKKKLWVLV